MTSSWEVAANIFNAASILLAARNSVHTWWTGVVGCLLFAWVFLGAHLYADVTLQAFFVITSAVGWWNWLKGQSGEELPIRRTAPQWIAVLGATAVVVAGGYGSLLHRFTDAYAPFLDSVILTFSVLGQFLLMGRRRENWWCWILVNTVAVPLYFSRGLQITALLYAGFWVNAVLAIFRWEKLLRTTDEIKSL